MKKTIIILAIFALIASSCEQATKKQVVNNSAPSWIDSTFTSDIRPNEKLQLGKIYTDNFEYIEYNDQGYDISFAVKKDGKIVSLLDDTAEGETPVLNRGDMVEIQWKIDSLHPVAGDNKLLLFKEFAEKVSITKK